MNIKDFYKVSLSLNPTGHEPVLCQDAGRKETDHGDKDTHVELTLAEFRIIH